jgi:hypothetical protein
VSELLLGSGVLVPAGAGGAQWYARLFPVFNASTMGPAMAAFSPLSNRLSIRTTRRSRPLADMGLTLLPNPHGRTYG